MEHTIITESIIERFQNGQTDFRDLGTCRVIGQFTPTETIVIENMVHLGGLVFEEEVNFGYFDFRCEEIHFGEVVFKNDFTIGSQCKLKSVVISLESATLEAGFDFDCNEFDGSLHLGSVNIEGEIQSLGALSKSTYIYAGDRPAVAWVLQQATQSNIQYQIADAPPWMQRPIVAQG